MNKLTSRLYERIGQGHATTKSQIKLIRDAHTINSHHPMNLSQPEQEPENRANDVADRKTRSSESDGRSDVTDCLDCPDLFRLP